MITTRPNVNQLVKAAMAGTLKKADINAEALRQIGTSAPPEEETAAHISTERVSKLASALGYLADMYKQADQGNVQMPGEGPGALPVSQATSSEPNIDAGESGQATAQHQLPKNPPLQREEVQQGKANTGLQTNDDANKPEQPIDPWANEKATLQNAYTKQSSALLARNYDRMMNFGREFDAPVREIRKLAEDKIYPASISAEHHEVPPPAVPAEQGKVSVPKDARSQMALVGSNQAAIDYTKGQAKADPKRDLAQVLAEPALTSRTDKVLQKTLDHTGEAGVKISMARDANRVAAARAFMSNLLDKVAAENGDKDEKEKGKKEKESMMGAAPSSPAQIPSPIQ
jgi:hypothetical protein